MIKTSLYSSAFLAALAVLAVPAHAATTETTTTTTTYTTPAPVYDTVGSTELSGEVGSFNAMSFQLLTANGVHNIDMVEMPYNPASKDMEPRLQPGDMVTLRADQVSGATYMARNIVAIKKSYEPVATRGQVYIENNTSQNRQDTAR